MNFIGLSISNVCKQNLTNCHYYSTTQFEYYGVFFGVLVCPSVEAVTQILVPLDVKLSV